MDIRKRIRPFYYLNVIYDGIKKKQPPLCMGNDKTRKFMFQSATVIIKRNKKNMLQANKYTIGRHSRHLNHDNFYR